MYILNEGKFINKLNFKILKLILINIIVLKDFFLIGDWGFNLIINLINNY